MKNRRLYVLILVFLACSVIASYKWFSDDAYVEARKTEANTWSIVMPANYEQPIIRINTETGESFTLEKKPRVTRVRGNIVTDSTATVNVWWPIYEKEEYQTLKAD